VTFFYTGDYLIDVTAWAGLTINLKKVDTYAEIQQNIPFEIM
jgi:hypothetical protein